MMKCQNWQMSLALMWAAGCMGRNSIPWLRCLVATAQTYGFKVRHWCKMALAVTQIFWLYFCIVGGSGEASSISFKSMVCTESDQVIHASPSFFLLDTSSSMNSTIVFCLLPKLR